MPRLFTALEIPPALAMELALLRGGLPGARWTEPSGYHVTLRFIGETGLAEAREIDAQLQRLRATTLSVTLDGLAAFGGAKPRAIYMAVRPSAALEQLQAAQESLLRRLGHAPETRKFVPHVTLARLRHTTALDAAGYLASQGFWPEHAFEARRFVLMSSRNSTGGGPYAIEAAYPLS